MDAADLHRMRATAVFAIADVRPHSGITAPQVARALERELPPPPAGEGCSFEVAPSTFPRSDFVISFHRRSGRDAALEQGSFTVCGVLFKLCPWVPPAGGPRLYCRLALEPLPLRAWEWDVVADMLGGTTCELDRMEPLPVARQKHPEVLFAWVWAWTPDDIPLTSELNLRNHATPEGEGTAAADEGSATTVLIHLDQALNYRPVTPFSSMVRLRIENIRIE